MNISKDVCDFMILHLSVAAKEADKYAAMFATVEGTDSSVSDNLKLQAETLRQGIEALKSSNLTVS